MVKLAVSDTPLSRQLVRGGRLDVDAFETSGPLTEGAVRELQEASIPLLLHNAVWDWSLSHPDALGSQDVLNLTRERLELTRAPWLSLHLGYSAAHVAFKKGRGFVPAESHGMQARSAALEQSATLETIVQNVRALQESIRVPLLLENLDFNPTGAYDHVCEPALIAETLEAADVDLLLDLAHAQVSASRLGYKLETYLEQLPLKRVQQLHISGPRQDGDTLFDAHEPLLNRDYALLTEVLGQTTPKVLTLEYDKDERALHEQVERLRLILDAAR